MIISHRKIDLWDKPLIEAIRIQPPYRLSVNFSQQACFIHYKKGKTLINSPAEQVLVNSDESVLLNCGTYFARLLEYPDGDYYEILVFHLHPETLRKLYRQDFPAVLKKEAARGYIQKLASQEIIHKFIENLYFYLGNPAVVSEDILQLKVKELILILLQTKNSTSIRELLVSLFSPHEMDIKEVIQRHLFSDISVQDLAGLCRMTLATFNRKFHALFNDTPAVYIKTQRLQRARHLLAVSTLTISEIAFQSGFNDIPHFTRSFKTQFGITPAACRASVH